MRRLAVLALLIAAVVLFVAPSATAQVDGEPAPTTTRAPLRPFDPPEPEPVFIPDLVSDLVIADMNSGLVVSPLTANPPAAAPGSGSSVGWADWIEFAAPAAIPLLMALAVLGLTRIPRRSPEVAQVDTGN